MSVSNEAASERGFTLMELLVAMTLLGILMTALFGSLQLGTRVWEVSEKVLDESEQTQVIRGFLRGRFEQALPMTLVQDKDQAVTIFKGERTALRFASSMPISVGADVFVLELSLKSRQTLDSRKDLVLRWRSFDPVRGTESEQASERFMIEDVHDIAFGYFGATEDGLSPSWSTVWQDQALLPNLIRIDIQFPANDQRRWPPLIVSPMIDEWYDTNY